MASHGKRETEALKQNLQGQLDRLLLQLEVRALSTVVAHWQAFSRASGSG
mgnify:CR=1 FL=1